MDLMTSFTSGTEISLKLLASGLLVAGAVAGFWKFVLQAPLGILYDVKLSPCRVARVQRDGGPSFAYTACLTVGNKSTAIQHMQGWWRRIRFSDGVPNGYDPDGLLSFEGADDVLAYFGVESRVDDYKLAPGEEYADQMIAYRGDGDQQLCFVEFALGYRCWGKRWRWIPYRRWEYLSQIMIAPVEGGRS